MTRLRVWLHRLATIAPCLVAGLFGLVRPFAAHGDEGTVWLDLGRLDPGELSLEVDDRPLSIVDVGEASSDWEVVLWFDERLSGPRAVRQGADALLEVVNPLVGLGDVSIVRVAPEPRVATPPDATEETLENVLYEVLYRHRAEDRVRKLRDSFVRSGREEALGHLREELELRRDLHRDLAAHLAGAPRDGRPRLLVVVSEAVALESADFYLRDEPPAARLDAPSEPELADLRDIAAARGWVVAGIELPPDAGSRRLQYRPDEDRPVGFRVGFGGPDEDEKPAPTFLPDEELALAGEGLLGPLAVPTGGSLAEGTRSLARLLDELGRRRPVTVDVPGELVGTSAALVVSPADVRGPERLAVGDPDALAAARARRFLDGRLDEGIVPMDVLLAAQPGVATVAPIEIATDWTELDLPAGPARITTVLQLDDGELLVGHRRAVTALDEDDVWRDTSELRLREDVAAIVVGVDDPATGSYGLAFATLVDSLGLASVLRDRSDPTTTIERLVRLVPPEGELSGRVEIRAEVDEAVTAVRFKLDGEVVAETAERPFGTRMRLGRGARQHVIEAIALDANGREVDRDVLVVNPPAEAFWVRVTSPRSGEHVGPVRVEADLKVPSDGRLERVDYYWNDELIATSRDQPHARTILIPYSQPSGFIRVEASLRDGRTTDDLVLMNSARFGSAVDVELVELLVVVTDDRGLPVNGLTRGNFTVLEDGREQELVGFSVAGDLPVTVGLAIDSSSSLFKRFPDVQRAATSFVESLTPRRDRAFLLRFGDAPRLVRPTTGDLSSVSHSINRLRVAGRTLVWEGIVSSLAELERARGRKALVVFYDGDDEDEKQSYRTAVELAEQSGVPIYLVVMNNQAASTGGQGFRTRSFTRRLEKIAEAGGGRVYFVRTDDDLDPIFESISEELRSHYLLAYYPQEEARQRQWRPIEVVMGRSGLEARTISGYEAEVPR